jgi:hypothetical protein
MPTFDPGLTFATSPAPDALFAGSTMPRPTMTVTVLSGQNLVRGAAVGRITASGKWVLSLTASSDGSEVIRGIMADACDASAADQRAGVYLKGEFNPAKVTFGTGHSSTVDFVACLDKGIIFKATVPA